ncbi:serine/threonine protein kinase [Actinokineospora sp. PR83]|uniref:serine/threonine-protein kinase n=1 Tax=Actinokineospora sp. PR83 TaxID=2884908 RepID=UPI001F40DFA8|nr:serine/threonine-protein kinase [Actinokineospora sp. PR83]MCG8915191.1 serine/threonine protein kinase [Actinokineospora sp. PR83]
MIAGRYRLEEQIGAGGMGVVWRATDSELRRVVALKRSTGGDDAQLRREAQVAAGLQHPNVVSMYDVVVHGADRWLVMEYFPARSIAATLAATGPLTPRAAAGVGAQIAAALVAMHDRRMVHRDVTPGNVLVAEDGTAKLTDFGIAHWAELTNTGDARVVGTPAYMAPEVANGTPGGPAADVFSLGATLFAAVEGHSPWGAPTHDPHDQQRRAMVGDRCPTTRAGELEPLLSDLLAHHPDVRPTLRAAKVQLEMISGITIPINPVAGTTGDATTPVGPPPRKRGVLLGSALLAAAVLAGAVVYANSGSTSLASPLVGMGNVGNERTADPCSLLDTNSLGRFGNRVVQKDTEYGEFNRCGMTVRLGEEDDNVGEVWVQILHPSEYESEPHPKGELGPPQYPLENKGKCERPIPLPDGNRVVVTARNKGGYPSELCSMASEVAGSVLAKLGQAAQIPRRAKPFDPRSLANADACATLQKEELAAVFTTPVTPEPDFGHWTCYWQTDSVDLTLVFSREWPESADEGENTVSTGVGVGYVGPESDESKGSTGCEIELIHRTYGEHTAINDDWMEVATLTLTSLDGSVPEEALCEKVTALGRLIAPRLPGH